MAFYAIVIATGEDHSSANYQEQDMPFCSTMQPLFFAASCRKVNHCPIAEAEYVALCAASQDASYLLQMLSELEMGDNSPIIIMEDNQAYINTATRDVSSPKLKHVDIRYHFVRTMVNEGKIKIIYCPTYHQATDILTKGTDKLTFIKYRSTLMGLPFRP